MTINIPDEILTRMPYTKSQLMLIYYFLYKNRLEELKALYNNFEDGDFIRSQLGAGYIAVS